MLLRLDTREAEKKEEEEGAPAARPGYTEFVSHTTWAHQMDFEEWKRRCEEAERACCLLSDRRFGGVVALAEFERKPLHANRVPPLARSGKW